LTIWAHKLESLTSQENITQLSGSPLLSEDRRSAVPVERKERKIRPLDGGEGPMHFSFILSAQLIFA